jgi:hypothetical protein
MTGDFCDNMNCAESGFLNYTCNYCERKFCSNHRLPENHDCPSLWGKKTSGPWFRQGDVVRRRIHLDKKSEENPFIESQETPPADSPGENSGRKRMLKILVPLALIFGIAAIYLW